MFDDIGQSWGDFDEFGANLAIVGMTSANFGQLCPIPARLQPMLGEIGQLRLELVRFGAQFGCSWPDSNFTRGL